MHYAYYEWEANRRQRDIIRGTALRQRWQAESVPLSRLSAQVWSGLWHRLDKPAVDVPTAQPYVATQAQSSGSASKKKRAS